MVESVSSFLYNPANRPARKVEPRQFRQLQSYTLQANAMILGVKCNFKVAHIKIEIKRNVSLIFAITKSQLSSKDNPRASVVL